MGARRAIFLDGNPQLALFYVKNSSGLFIDRIIYFHDEILTGYWMATLIPRSTREDHDARP